MSHKLHDLTSEFPSDSEVLHRLRAKKGHFAALADRYQEVNEAIFRIEAELNVASDTRTEDLKKERLSLLDKIRPMIVAERSAVV